MIIMCGRYTLRRDYKRIHHQLRIEGGSGSVIFKPRYNIAPTDRASLASPHASPSTIGWNCMSGRADKPHRRLADLRILGDMDEIACGRQFVRHLPYTRAFTQNLVSYYVHLIHPQHPRPPALCRTFRALRAGV
jgi:putative SOS response-associated peptidase YedK